MDSKKQQAEESCRKQLCGQKEEKNVLKAVQQEEMIAWRGFKEERTVQKNPASALLSPW